MIETVIETVVANKILALVGGGGVIGTYLLRGVISKTTSIVINYVLIDLMAKLMPRFFQIGLLSFVVHLNNFLEQKKTTKYGPSYTEFEKQLISVIDETGRILRK